MNYYNDYYKENNSGSKLITMIVVGIVAIVVIALISLAGTFIGSYNSLVDIEEDVKVAQADVQNMMQRRLELIPDLVKTADAAAEHEEIMNKDVTSARAALNASTNALNELLENGGDIQDIDKANSELTASINNLLVIVENYPTVTANQHYTTLMDQLEGSVNRISVARDAYNEIVGKYNKKVRRFPGNIIAGMFGFEQIEPFKADEEANNSSLVNFD